MEKGEAFWIYIIECQDGSFYVGMTESIVNRLSSHLMGKGSLHVKHRKWRRLLQCWILFEDRTNVARVEKYIKTLTKTIKEEIVASPELLQQRITNNLKWPIKMRVVENFLVGRKVVESHPDLAPYFQQVN